MLKAIRYDLKLLKGDPMLLISMCVPLMVWALMQFAFPLLQEFVVEQWTYDIGMWRRHAGYFFMILIPMMTGMVYGFILVDERDEGILPAIAVTPLGKSGYLRTRLALPTLLSFLVLLLFQLVLGLTGSLQPLQWILLSLLISIQALLLLLVLGAFAANKIMGLALSKGFGMLLIAPLLDFALPGQLKWIGAYSPMFWTGRAFMATENRIFWIYFLAAFVYESSIILILYRIFNQRQN